MKVIWLNGMPRSGTSWLGQLFDSSENVNFKLSPLFSYAFKNAVGKNSSKEEWQNFFEQVYHSNDEFINQTQRRLTGEYPIFPIKNESPEFLVIKETRYHNLTQHILDTFNEIKFIHIVRNPCGAIYSWLTAPREFPKDANPMEEWKTGRCRKTGEEEFWGFNDWKKLTEYYLLLEQTYSKNVMVVSYDKLVSDTLGQVNDMFHFAGLSLNDQTRKFIEESTSKNIESAYAVYKNKEVASKWKTNLQPEIIAEITQELKGGRLEKFM